MWNKLHNRRNIIPRKAEQKFLTIASYLNLFHICLYHVFCLISEVFACFPAIHSPKQTICVFYNNLQWRTMTDILFFGNSIKSGTVLQPRGQLTQLSSEFFQGKLKEGSPAPNTHDVLGLPLSTIARKC